MNKTTITIQFDHFDESIDADKVIAEFVNFYTFVPVRLGNLEICTNTCGKVRQIDVKNVCLSQPSEYKMLQTLKTIRTLIDSPHWTTERKYRIRELADKAINDYLKA